MAAGFLPLPGTQIGPCKHDCDHRDCVETKSIAASPCVRCGNAIGFDIGFYTSGDQHVHARCEERAVERETLARQVQVTLGERCRWCGQPMENPHDMAGPRTCGDCRHERYQAMHDEIDHPPAEC